MFITAVKTCIVEALDAGFAALASSPIDTSLDLVPNNITIEYPLEVVEWPSILVQFRPSKVQWTGLNPDYYTQYPSGVTISGINYSAVNVTRTCFFEGAIDLQIMAMHSEERDKLWDSVTNLILIGPGSPASNAFYQSITNNDLVALTLLGSTYTPLGDTITAGTPWSPEELTYEASVRIQCIGQFFGTKYDYREPIVEEVSVSGSAYIGQNTDTGIFFNENIH
jgi:hypothetical protein